ncbi:hypothetical protein AWB67_00896 [Caballeronia terrestris]|jgi:hypothetical protein|uniref:Uncharacterized protein n=1 Tax=Caballeronia terrestris TaxID=1226301 RepID=A0A158FUR8_9BURK|nr:hypothetical protein AWB67_00896 [Caballeronia terrestris]
MGRACGWSSKKVSPAARRSRLGKGAGVRFAGRGQGNCQAFGSSMSRSFLLDTDAAVVALIFKKETKTTRSMFLFVRLR